MAAAKIGNPIITSSQTTRQYLYRWTYADGVWTNEPYKYRDVVTIEYRQMCTADYTKESIGSPGTSYEVVMFDKVASRGPYAELVTVWKSKATLAWSTYPIPE